MCVLVLFEVNVLIGGGELAGPSYRGSVWRRLRKLEHRLRVDDSEVVDVIVFLISDSSLWALFTLLAIQKEWRG